MRANAANQALHVASGCATTRACSPSTRAATTSPTPPRKPSTSRPSRPPTGPPRWWPPRRVQGVSRARAGRFQGGPVQLRPAELLVGTPGHGEPRRRTFTNAGGAFGFDTEASPGNTIPTQDSLARFLTDGGPARSGTRPPPTGRARVRTCSTPAAVHRLHRLARWAQYNTALWQRYGPWSDMTAYQRRPRPASTRSPAPCSRPTSATRKDPANPSTGVIYWQLNKAWPSLQWSCTATTSTSRACTSAPRRRTSRCTSCTPTTRTASRSRT